MQLIRERSAKPWTAVIYGTPGVGKTTLASMAPGAVIVDLENGLRGIDCPSTPFIEDWEGLRSALTMLAEDKDCITVVIDTLPAVEEILTRKILMEHKKDLARCTLADFGYGAGFEALKSNWVGFMRILFWLGKQGKNVLCVAHEQIEEIKNPSDENYDRYTLNCHKKSVPILCAKMDAVLYAHFERYVIEKKTAKAKMAIDTGKRFLLTQEKPYALAKNRFRLPELVPFNTREEIKTFYEGVQ